MKSYGVIQVYKGRKYYFITIAEALNITRAAERLMVSQPSLTQYLNHLENELEVKLVDRNFTPLRLTRAGKLYYDYLRDEKAREEQFIAELEELKNESRPPLRIGLPLQKRFEGLSKALLQFCMERPSLNVSVWEGTSATVRERVLKGELDIGFGHYVEEQDDRFIVQTIRKEKIVIQRHSRMNTVELPPIEYMQFTVTYTPKKKAPKTHELLSDETLLVKRNTRLVHSSTGFSGQETMSVHEFENG